MAKLTFLFCALCMLYIPISMCSGISEYSEILFDASSSISTESEHGKYILQHARALEENKYYNNNNKFLKKYAIKFQKCYSVNMFEGGEGGDRRRRRKLEDDNENYSKIYTQRLVRFRLCPVDECVNSHKNGCKNGYGDYVVDMSTFLQAFLPAREKDRENICTNAAYECNCGDGDGEGDNDGSEYKCKLACFQRRNLGFCIDYLKKERYEDNYGRDKFGVYLDDFSGECEELGGEGDDRRKLNEDENDEKEEDNENENEENNNNYNRWNNLFMGPYCSDDGERILVGVFKNNDCSIFADSNQGATTYESVTGTDLPYHSYSLVNNTCQNCYVTERYEDDDEDVFENVVELYEKSAKCEKLMNIFSPSERECSYVNGMDILELSLAGKLKKKGSIAAGFAIFFMMGLLFLTGSYAYFLKHKLQQSKKGLMYYS